MLTSRGLGIVLGDLASIGYDAEWEVLGASDVGARHQRNRIWIVAKRNKFFSHTQHNRIGRRKQQSESIKKENGAMANTGCELWKTRNPTELDSYKEIGTTSTIHNKSSSQRQIPNSSSKRQQGQRQYVESICKKKVEDWKTSLFESIGQRQFWEIEPNVGRVANGMADAMDRLKAIGNGQVPLCAATAWKLLKERLENGHQ
jgi:DNA (cytosine-5)-methyltransferase 1